MVLPGERLFDIFGGSIPPCGIRKPCPICLSGVLSCLGSGIRARIRTAVRGLISGGRGGFERVFGRAGEHPPPNFSQKGSVIHPPLSTTDSPYRSFHILVYPYYPTQTAETAKILLKFCYFPSFGIKNPRGNTFHFTA